jgi:hypothetical protein
MRSFVVKLLQEDIELGLLLKQVGTGGARGFFLQRQMHALVTTVLLRMAGPDAFDADAEPQPPLGQISAADRCEELIGKHRGMFVDRTALQWDLDPSKMSDEQLDVLAMHLLKQELGTDDPTILAEARKQIEAGIEAGAVVIDVEPVP